MTVFLLLPAGTLDGQKPGMSKCGTIHAHRHTLCPVTCGMGIGLLTRSSHSEGVLTPADIGKKGQFVMTKRYD